MRMYWLLSVISIALLASVLFALCTWLHTSLEFTSIVITSSGKTLHFFDTQAVTQKIMMEQAANIARIEIPWHPPTIDTPVMVEMRRNGKLLSRWRIRTIGDGSREVLSLSFPVPQYIDGSLDISFHAPEIDRKQLENVPKLFLEPFDGSFSSGNYRIGDDEKEGDIQMRFIGERERIEIVKQDFMDNPWQGSSRLLSLLGVICLVMAFPYLLYRSVKV